MTQKDNLKLSTSPTNDLLVDELRKSKSKMEELVGRHRSQIKVAHSPTYTAESFNPTIAITPTGTAESFALGGMSLNEQSGRSITAGRGSMQTDQNFFPAMLRNTDVMRNTGEFFKQQIGFTSHTPINLALSPIQSKLNMKIAGSWRES